MDNDLTWFMLNPVPLVFWEAKLNLHQSMGKYSPETCGLSIQKQAFLNIAFSPPVLAQSVIEETLLL